MYQPVKGFRFGTDTVLLAWFTASLIKPGRRLNVLELGAGSGAGSLLLWGRRPDLNITGVELDPGAKELFERNIEFNGLERKIRAALGDVRNLPEDIRQTQYDVVFMNPPFFNEQYGPKANSNNPGRVRGRYEEYGSLEDFLRAGASRVIPSGGMITVVMTAERAAETVSLMASAGIKPTHMMYVHPFMDKNAQMVLIAGKTGGSNPKLQVMPPLILNERFSDGSVNITNKLTDIYGKEQTDCFI